MEVTLLFTTPNVNVYYDAVNQWLYLDWHGDLNLNMVRSSCLQIASRFLMRRYKRILNDNTNVNTLTPDVAPWLAKEYLPYLRLAGIEYVAWIYSLNTDTQSETEAALQKISAPVIALFDDMATAYDWLSGAQFQSPVMLQTPTLSVAQSDVELQNRITFLGGNQQ